MSQEHLLPSSSAPQEKALAGAIGRLSAVPVRIGDLWNPDKCPVEFLPWLGWAVSVDEWSDDWSESQQRAAIKSSLAVHRIKGTVAAVKAVLAPYGATVALTEWWQKTPKGEPHTFDIDVVVSGDGAASASFLDSLKRSIDKVKPVRSHYDLTTGVKFTHAMGLAGTVRSLQFQTFSMEE